MEIKNEPQLRNSAVRPTILVREPPKIKSTLHTPQLTSLLKAEPDTEAQSSNGSADSAPDAPFSAEQLREAWDAYAKQRRKFQAEYQMLSQPYTIEDNVIVVELLSPVHETMLSNIKSELTAFLREKLGNHTLQVTGQLQTGEEKKVLYTNREKFDFLVEKNPMLRALRDRLGLDTDF